MGFAPPENRTMLSRTMDRKTLRQKQDMAKTGHARTGHVLHVLFSGMSCFHVMSCFTMAYVCEVTLRSSHHMVAFWAQHIPHGVFWGSPHTTWCVLGLNTHTPHGVCWGSTLITSRHMLPVCVKGRGGRLPLTNEGTRNGCAGHVSLI